MPQILPGISTVDGDQRDTDRFGVGLPFTLDGVTGQTRDLSATGVSFESLTERAVGSIVKLQLHYGLDGHNFPMDCEAEVVRVTPEIGGFLIAARLLKPFFAPQGKWEKCL